MLHDHSNDTHNYNRAFATGIALNMIFVATEVIFGLVADSLALIADAGHNLSDVLSLVMAWGASHLARKHSTIFRTYGLRRVTILTSLASSIFLMFVLGGITWEAFGRMTSPQPVNTTIVIVVAAAGVIINTVTALLFLPGQKHDLNLRAAYLHMAADAGVSAGVVIAGIAILITGWLWLDAVISLAIVTIILISTLGLLKESINLSIDAVPKDIEMAAIIQYLSGIEGVRSFHDLHVWALSTTETALTVHLVTGDLLAENNLLPTLQQHLHDEYGIEHVTIQVENEHDAGICTLNREGCI